MEVKEYKFIYPPTIYSKKNNVVYVAGKNSSKVSEFLMKNYLVIKSEFARRGLYFHFLSAEMVEQYKLEENDTVRFCPESEYYGLCFRSKQDVLQELLRFFKDFNGELPEELNNDSLKERHKRLKYRLCYKNKNGGNTFIYPLSRMEEISYRYSHAKAISSTVDSLLIKYLDDSQESQDFPSCLIFSNRNWHGKGTREISLTAIPFDTDDDNLEAQIKDMIDYISLTKIRDMYKKPSDYFSSLQIAAESNYKIAAEERYESFEEELARIRLRMREEGLGDEQMEDLWHRSKAIENNGCNIIITKDYRIILEQFDNKEFTISDLPKALYIFFLKHEEGLTFDEMKKYMPEIAFIYIKTRKNTRRWNILHTVENLFLGQFSNNFNEIRDKFQEIYDLSRDNIYTLERDKKHQELLKIEVPESQRIWQCPDILHKEIPTLPANSKNMLKDTWIILHDLNDDKVNAAIGDTPPED